MIEAEKYCADQGHRFTAPRGQVLEIVSGVKGAISAYDIIAKMPTGTKPPTVYRALDFWILHGFIHRIGSLNLYAACHAGHRHQGSQYLICDGCGSITEIHLCHLPPALRDKAGESGFSLLRWSAELHGLCRACQ